MQDEKLLDAKEVAEILKIHWRTVTRMVERGELPAYEVAGQYRFRREDIDKYLERKRIQPKKKKE
jgi:excisionase family DNA binding protein